MTSNLARLAAAFDPARMDALLLLAPTDDEHRLSRPRRFHDGAPTASSRGAASARWCRSSMPAPRSCRPRSFAGVPPGPSSMSPLFDRAVEAGRLCGLRLDGVWMHVGTPDAITAAEAAIVDSAA